MRSQFEHAVEDERAALEEDVAPVPAIVLDDIVGFSLDPQIERNERDTADPPNMMLEFSYTVAEK